MTKVLMNDEFKTLQKFDAGNGREGLFHSLPALEEQGVGKISRLPISIRIVLESVLRNCDGKKVRRKDVETLANWNAKKPANEEIPFVVARIVLQDFTGVPLVVDLAAMRSAVERVGADPKIIEPLVPVDLVVDHSVQVDFFGSADALRLNLEMEFKRNRERYQFLKWGQQAFKTFQLVPPGIGIVHQVNLEYLAKGVLFREIENRKSKIEIFYPDTLVGTDSHTTMINGLGVVGWGVGGIEAEAGMLGQPVYFLTPEVVGVHLRGRLREGVTATDLVLHITQLLRAQKVVGKFVEFYGEGAASLPVPDRATIGNMSPEYGATMGFFPVDNESVAYLRATGRTDEQCAAFENYFRAQKMFGMPPKGEIDYSVDLDVDLADVQPSVAGPKRPQDRIDLPSLGDTFRSLFARSVKDGGYGKAPDELEKRFPIELNGHAVPTDGELEAASVAGPTDSLEAMKGGEIGETMGDREMVTNRPTATPADMLAGAHAEEFRDGRSEIGHGSVLIAAITSCTNTSNPSVMLASGLLAKKAVERGLRVDPAVKTSLAPGSRVVTDYLSKTGLQKYLDQLGFNIVGYGCTTCIGNSGPLDPKIEKAINDNDLIAASVLSGNRNFEARVHQNIKANFLMSPPLVVAFALAGRVDVDLTKQPLGKGRDGEDVYLRDLWPSLEEIRDAMQSALTPEVFRRLYRDFAEQNPKWNEIPSSKGDVYLWDEKSDYIHEPPFFKDFSMDVGRIDNIAGARALGIFGDSVTTDHISPAGAIKSTSPAGKYLISRGIEPPDFNSYGSRRGNDLVMTRGTFANVRIKNLMVPGIEGGVTKYWGARAPSPAAEGASPSVSEEMSIFDAAMKYQEDGVPLVILAGHEYGTGSSRDWAAKGTRLLGVKAVVAASFERIHRSNLVGMGVLPLQFHDGTNAQSLGIDGSETFSITGLSDEIRPGQEVALEIRKNGEARTVPVKLRIDTAIEVDYYRHGGILPYVLRQLLTR
jgi:aconitate hydratase